MSIVHCENIVGGCAETEQHDAPWLCELTITFAEIVAASVMTFCGVTCAQQYARHITQQQTPCVIKITVRYPNAPHKIPYTVYEPSHEPNSINGIDTM